MKATIVIEDTRNENDEPQASFKIATEVAEGEGDMPLASTEAGIIGMTIYRLLRDGKISEIAPYVLGDLLPPTVVNEDQIDIVDAGKEG